MDAFDAVTLVLFTALAGWLPLLLALKSNSNHVWLGVDGPNAGDQLQYLGWVQQSSRHLLISDPFVTAPARADFLDPGLAISGVLTRLGVSTSLAYYFWVPVAIVALFAAVRLLVRRLLTGTAQRRFALVIALFYVSPTFVVSAHLLSWLPAIDRFFIQPTVADMWPVSYLWGYPLSAVAVALLCFALLTFERDRKAARFRLWAPLLGLFCAWLQPWQGATLLGVVVSSEAIMWLRGDKSGVALPVTTAGATALPLAYYALLSHIDPAWSLAGRLNFLVIPASTFLVVLIPLGVPSLLAYRSPPKSFQEVSVRAWPFVALAQILFTSVTHIGTFAVHAVEGLSVPFAILAVIGICSLHVRFPAGVRIGLAAALVAVLVVPSGIQMLNSARQVGNPVIPGEDMFVNAGEWSALNYLKNDPVPGAVLSPPYLGQAVPAITGRLTWVGIYSWTPSFAKRAALADQLLSGDLDVPEATQLVRSSNATFILSDCRHHADLAVLLPTIVEPGKRFGCATVYRVRRFQ